MIQDKVNFSSPKYKAIGKPSIIIKQGEDVVYEHHGKNAFNTDVFKLVTWTSVIQASRLVLLSTKTETNPFPPNGLCDFSNHLLSIATPTTTSSDTFNASYNPYIQVLASRTEKNKIKWVFAYNYTPEQGNGEIKSIRLYAHQPYERHIYNRYTEGNLPVCVNGKYGYSISSNVITVTDKTYSIVKTITLQSTSDAFTESGIDSTVYYYSSTTTHNYYKKETVYMIYARSRYATNGLYTHVIYAKKFLWDSETYTSFQKVCEVESSTTTYSYASAVYYNETLVFADGTGTASSVGFYIVTGNEIVEVENTSVYKCYNMACRGCYRTGSTSWISGSTTGVMNYVNDELICVSKAIYAGLSMLDPTKYRYAASSSIAISAAMLASTSSNQSSSLHLFDDGCCGDYYGNSTYGSNYMMPVVAAYNLPETVVKTSDQTMTITYEIEVTIDE
ncbi:MAG: hypothetical protein R3Y12_05460 [Clostridia bacterium]